MARPKIEIDSDDFEKLCGMHCTAAEIAGFFGCSVDTIERWCKRTYKMGFADCFKRFSAPGKISLRRKQYHVAMDGNVSMLIFLGKQYLGQSDKVETVHSVDEVKDDPLSETLREIAKGLKNADQ